MITDDLGKVSLESLVGDVNEKENFSPLSFFLEKDSNPFPVGTSFSSQPPPLFHIIIISSIVVSLQKCIVSSSSPVYY